MFDEKEQEKENSVLTLTADNVFVDWLLYLLVVFFVFRQKLKLKTSENCF